MSSFFIIIGLALLGGAAALTIRALVFPRLRTVARLEQIAGYGASGGRAGTFVADATEADPHRMASAVGHLVARSGRVDLEPMRKLLLAAGYYRMSPETVLGYRILLTAMLGALALTVGLGSLWGIVQGVLLVVVGWFGPLIALQRLGVLRSQRIDDALPDLVDLLVVTVEAGLSFSASMQKATERVDGPLGDELRLTMQEQRMGLPITEGLGNMLRRCESQSMRSFVQSVTQAETLGVSIGQVLRGLAIEMRKRRRARAEERANKAPIKMLFPLVFLLFPALFVVILAPGAIELMQGLGQ